MYSATFKDVLIGQVRKIEITAPNGYNSVTIPPSLNITKQQGFTWDNKTGLNPLWNKSPSQETIYYSYADMIEQTLDMGSSAAEFCCKRLATSDDYTTMIRADYSNSYTMFLKYAARWWLIQKALEQPDALDYDYTIYRQYDTIFYDLPEKDLEFIFGESEKNLVGLQPKGAYPIMFTLSAISPKKSIKGHITNMWPMIQSGYHIFNRAAVRILRKHFYRMIMAEIDHFYKRYDIYSPYILGYQINLLNIIATKNDILQFDSFHYPICRLSQPYTPNANWGGLERA